MDSPRISQQTTTTLPLRGELTHDAPAPLAIWRGSFSGPLQWALEGPGWGVVRPTVDFVLLCVAIVAALGGVQDTLQVSATSAPLLAMPVLVVLLLYLRGLYRTRLRALVLDGIIPVISGVSVAAMAVATLGMFANGTVPDQSDWVRAWIFSVIAVALGRVMLSFAQRCGASPAPRRQVRADPRRGRRRSAGREEARRAPRVRALPDRLPRRGPALGRGGRRARRASARHGRGPRQHGRAHRREEPDRRLLLGRRRARQPADPALSGTRRRGLGRPAHVRHDQRSRRL